MLFIAFVTSSLTLMIISNSIASGTIQNTAADDIENTYIY